MIADLSDSSRQITGFPARVPPLRSVIGGILSDGANLDRLKPASSKASQLTSNSNRC